MKRINMLAKLNCGLGKYILISIIFSLFLIPTVKAQYYETRIYPENDEQFKKAEYRIWLPTNVKTIRGIIFRQHGCGINAASTGLDHANDMQWQALAQKYDMALMGSHMEHEELCAQWFDTGSGSERAFLFALKNLSSLSGHPEIEKVPWALWGHSGGAYWCTNLMFKYPERILVVINRSGGIATSKWNSKLKEVPVLWVVGRNELDDGCNCQLAQTVKSFVNYRKFGALWTIVVDPKADHGNRFGRSFYIRYMDAMISLRLPKEGIVCKTLDVSVPWLGNWKTKEIFKWERDSTGFNYAWFPNWQLAQQWKEFSKTGWVTDMSNPPEPYNLQIKRHNNEYILEWEVYADLESGVKQFNIYRNGGFLTSILGQKPNYGDVGEPNRIECRYLLEQVKGNYSVSSINYQGLESLKSVIHKNR